jgi:putative tricarboxylic transport membrane protein
VLFWVGVIMVGLVYLAHGSIRKALLMAAAGVVLGLIIMGRFGIAEVLLNVERSLQVLRVPYRILFPLILLFCLVGVYSVGNAVFDIYVMIAFGVAGYLLRKCDYEPAPLVLAFVLGPLLENNLRKALILSQGSFGIFLARPISAVCLGLAGVLLVSPLWPRPAPA